MNAILNRVGRPPKSIFFPASGTEFTRQDICGANQAISLTTIIKSIEKKILSGTVVVKGSKSSLSNKGRKTIVYKML